MGQDKWKIFLNNLDVKDTIFIITLISVDDPENQFLTLCSGTQQLAYFLLHYDRNKYEFAGAEELCPGNRMIWDYNEILMSIKKDTK